MGAALAKNLKNAARRTFPAWTALAFLLASRPAGAAGEISILLPLNGAYTTERTIPIMGMVKGPPPDQVSITVNDRDTFKFKIKDGYYFAGDIYIEDGINTISAGKQTIEVMAGNDKSPPKGYRLQYGHAGPDDTCNECHEAVLSREGNLVSLKLLEPPETLCYWCHLQPGKPQKQGRIVSTHQPVKEGQCLSCHLPHASLKRGLLKTESKNLCRPCHQQFYDDLKTKAYIHGPLNVGGCDLCHLTHSSTEPFLLNTPEKQLCAGCHGGMDIPPEKAKVTSTHPGINEGRCHDCHSAHASNNPKMMKKIVNNLCIECHPEKSHNFHEEKGFSIYICGRCHNIHNPDSDHLVINESRALCDQCHKNLGRGDYEHKVLADKSCFECHTFHQTFMDRKQAAVCFRCHPRNAAFDTVHPVSMSDEVRCTSCHSPHRSTTANLTYPVRHKPFAEKKCGSCHDDPDLKPAGQGAGAGDILCFKCHPEKKMPTEAQEGIIIHKPFSRENCHSCHLTHNSQYNYLLTMETLDLCGQCHSFVKKMKTLAPASSHPGVKEGLCGNCHDSHLGTNEKLLKKKPQELCLSCHAKLLESPDGGKLLYIHKPMLTEPCSRCHEGHFSKFPALLKEKQLYLCQKCHEGFYRDMNNPSNRYVHQPAKTGACGKCHSPHGSDGKTLLKSAGNNLCKSCHENLLKGLHHEYQPDFTTYNSGPLAGVRVSCLECHRSHYSPNKYLITRTDAPICKRCHRF